MAPVSRYHFSFLFTFFSAHPQAYFYTAGWFCYCHLYFQISKNTERTQISTLALAMHFLKNRAALHVFSRMKQKPGIYLPKFYQAVWILISVSSSDLCPHPGSSASTFSSREDRPSFMKSPHLTNFGFIYRQHISPKLVPFSWSVNQTQIEKWVAFCQVNSRSDQQLLVIPTQPGHQRKRIKKGRIALWFTEHDEWFVLD